MKIKEYNNQLHYLEDGKELSKVYLVQDIPVDRESGQPKYNVMGAQKYGETKHTHTHREAKHTIHHAP